MGHYVYNDELTSAQNAINATVHDAVNASTLRHEDYLRYQSKVTTVRRDNLFGIQDLISRGLVVSEEFTTTLIGVEKLNEFQEAIQSMGEVTDLNNDTVFTEDLTPLPITMSGFSVQARQNKSYKVPAGVGESTRKVSLKLENMLFNGSPTIVSGGNTVYGYTTHPNRMTDSISDWSDYATNGDKVIPELTNLVARMVEEAFVAGKKLMLYIPPNFNATFRLDYKDAVKGSIYERALSGNPELIDIKVSHRLASGTIAMVAMEDNTIELSRAADISIIPHVVQRGMLEARKWTNFAIIAPVFKPDSQNNLALLTASV